MVLFAKRLIWNLNFGKNPNFADKLLNNFERFLRVQQGLGAITVEGHLKAARKFIKVTGTVFPTKEEISWESHLYGFLTGLVLAILYRKKDPFKKYDWEEEEITLQFKRKEL